MFQGEMSAVRRCVIINYNNNNYNSKTTVNNEKTEKTKTIVINKKKIIIITATTTIIIAANGKRKHCTAKRPQKSSLVRLGNGKRKRRQMPNEQCWVEWLAARLARRLKVARYKLAS